MKGRAIRGLVRNSTFRSNVWIGANEEIYTRPGYISERFFGYLKRLSDIRADVRKISRLQPTTFAFPYNAYFRAFPSGSPLGLYIHISSTLGHCSMMFHKLFKRSPAPPVFGSGKVLPENSAP